MHEKKLVYQKYPRKPVLAIYNLIDKIKFRLNIKPTSKLAIVSASDSTHFKSLIQFIKSVQYYENGSRTVIYDLGMTKEETDIIRRDYPFVRLRVFDYTRYPWYFNIKIEAGRFAWKPVIILKVLSEFRLSTIWFDAGCKLTQPLYRIRDIINKEGFYSPIVLPGAIKDWVHPQFVESLNASDKIINNASFNGAMIAINYNHSKATKFVNKWISCALEEKCWVPSSSSKKNHRWQTIMSILAYQLELAGEIPYKRIGFLVHQDID